MTHKFGARKVPAPVSPTIARPKDDVVIDLETLGTGQDAVIVSIGAVIFNRADPAGTVIDTLDIKIDIEDQPGRVVDAGTAKWWMKASMKDARNAAFFKDSHQQVRLGLALKQLADFMAKYDLGDAWGCSPSFDMVILQHAYRQHKDGNGKSLDFPMPFWKWSCIRTIESFFYGKNTRKPGGENWLDGTAHDALDDCKMEASVIQKCYFAATNVNM